MSAEEMNVDGNIDSDGISSTEDEMDVEDNLQIAELTDEQRKKMAENKKLEGNEFYKQQDYTQALKLYSEAIELCPNCAAYYGNKSATYMMMKKYSEALDQARTATQLDPDFVKGYLREAKCHLAMGNAVASLHNYQKVLQLDPQNKTALLEVEQAKAVLQFEEMADKDFITGDFRRAVFCMERCIEQAPSCVKYKIRKAEALALLKRYQESQEIANDILRFDGANADAIYVRGMCLYYQDNVEKAFQHFQQVLRFAPDHEKAKDIYKKAKQLKAKKEEGNEAFRLRKFEDAYRIYGEALEIDPYNVFTNSKLYCNRATVCSKIQKLDQAIEDCTKAVELDEKYLKAYMRRAKCYMDKEMFDEAVRDYEKIYKLDKTRENKRLVQDAKLELKKSKRKDYYKILGVGKAATDDEIKKAYKKRALIHHPDRHANANDEERKEEEKKFKEIGEAYSVLSDAKKKARYDSGQDLEDLDGGGFSDIDPNTIFQAFFGGGPGGFSFHQGNHGNPYGGGGGGGGGFPGGFTFQFG